MTMQRNDMPGARYRREESHDATTGQWTEPSAAPNGRRLRGTTYLACSCGWRLTGITYRERAVAKRLFTDHRRVMYALRRKEET